MRSGKTSHGCQWSLSYTLLIHSVYQESGEGILGVLWKQICRTYLDRFPFVSKIDWTSFYVLKKVMFFEGVGLYLVYV